MKILIINKEHFCLDLYESNPHSPNKFAFDDSSYTRRLLVFVVEELFAGALLVMLAAAMYLEVSTSDMLDAVKQRTPCIILSLLTTAESRHTTFP